VNERQLKEILFDLFYAKYLAHGTDGHNVRLIMAEMARAAGYSLDADCLTMRKDGEIILKLEAWR